MDIRNVVSLSAGFLLLGAVGYYWGGFGKSPLSVAHVSATGLPDYEVTGIEGVRTNQSGQVVELFSAQSIRHYPESDRSEIRRPVMRFFEDGNERWELRAAQAVGLNDNRNISLNGKVQAETLGEGQSVSLETDMLEVDRDEQVLRTDSAVAIRSGNNILDSLGLHVDIRGRILELPAQVRGIYVLPSH
ncbi:LPS export ABC transporter protein LptC [Fluviicoccus keumensis]|uniref:LPS export ABC transporter protein LptC n=1 Tax=Fluviicoccus keumensis TaxID=1435465 RepID=A0A4Q7Z497_9GAMM|nr:LPS export ABC transporter periplasmic protein LptC [Fluviicoccus keumensis]RZU45160.1 LPS export ABC transporter protein LptC [Fluviicoccus keumensis]